ncbi:hypothetical protein QTN25_008997 [Entamoeba marina]
MIIAIIVLLSISICVRSDCIVSNNNEYELLSMYQTESTPEKHNENLLHNNNLLIVDDHHKYLPRSYFDHTLHNYGDSSSLFIDQLDEETINFFLNDDSIYQSLKNKLNETFDKGTKWLAKNGDKIADKLKAVGDVAGKVEMVSGVVQGVATVASAIPGVGFIAGPIAAGAGAVRLTAAAVGLTVSTAEQATRLATEFSKGYQEGGVKVGLEKTGEQAVRSTVALGSRLLAEKAAHSIVGVSSDLAGRAAKGALMLKKVKPNKLVSSIGKLTKKMMPGNLKGAGKASVDAVKRAAKSSVKAVKGAGKSTINAIKRATKAGKAKSGALNIKNIKKSVTEKLSAIKKAPTAIKNNLKSKAAEYGSGYNVKKNLKDSWDEMQKKRGKAFSTAGQLAKDVSENYSGGDYENKVSYFSNKLTNKLIKKWSNSRKLGNAVVSGPKVIARNVIEKKLNKAYDDHKKSKKDKNKKTTTASNKKQSTSVSNASSKSSQKNSSPTTTPTSTISKRTSNKKNNTSANVASANGNVTNAKN